MKCMTKMENAVMNLAHCDRMTANLVANAVLDIDRATNTERGYPLSPSIEMARKCEVFTENPFLKIDDRE